MSDTPSVLPQDSSAPQPAAPGYPFFGELARTLNGGVSRSVVLAGNVGDLFYLPDASAPGGGRYVPLLTYLAARCAVPGLTLLVYELNGPVRVVGGGDGWERLKSAWVSLKTGVSRDELILQSLTDKKVARQREFAEAEFDRLALESVGQPTVALEFLRQLTVAARARDAAGKPRLADNLMILIEQADLLLPGGDGDLARLNPADRQRLLILTDWFTEPAFTDGNDSVVLLAQSAAALPATLLRLPTVVRVEVPKPDQTQRRAFIDSFYASAPTAPKPADADALALGTAGLSLQALRQTLLRGKHESRAVGVADIVASVEAFLMSELGEDTVEFKRPAHTLADVVGFAKLKRFIRDEMMPRIRAGGDDALSGAAVAGPIGGGKTFVFEAMAAELGLPVLVLKNVRSQWFGQTDVLFERLRATLESLGRAVIFVDEADTQFGGVGAGAHETERRLTGKVQAMMSDAALRGRVTWLLMTARIHLLSPDIRRPGRAGDLIIPVLDPEGEDLTEFVRWMLAKRVADVDAAVPVVTPICVGFSAATFSALRATLKAKAGAKGSPLTTEEAVASIRDYLPPAIGLTRRYQTLQALSNTTRRSLLPNPDVTDAERAAWADELRALERQGVE